MVEVKYANAYKEILEILKYIPIEEYKKYQRIKLIFLKQTLMINMYLIMILIKP